MMTGLKKFREDLTEKNKFEVHSETFKNIFSQKINILLDEIIISLGGRCEQLFNLYKLEYTDKEKSEIMRIPIGSVKSAFNNCKKKLMKCLNKEALKIEIKS